MKRLDKRWDKVLKKVLVVIYIIDILRIPLSVYVLIWWEKEHNEPGLAEMIDGRRLVIGLGMEIIIFIVLTVILLKIRLKTRKKDRP